MGVQKALQQMAEQSVIAEQTTVVRDQTGETVMVCLKLQGAEVLEAALADHQETWKLYRAALDENARLRIELEALQVQYQGKKLGEG